MFDRLAAMLLPLLDAANRMRGCLRKAKASFDGERARDEHPRRIVVRTELQRTALGKVQRSLLRQQLQS